MSESMEATDRLNGHSENAASPPVAALVPDRVARWAAERPWQPAVVSDSETVTYGELIERATSLAGRMRKAGVGRDIPVALWLERSVDLVSASLAAMVAGGAYLILDTDQPHARLSALLEDSRAPVLVTSRDVPEGLARHDVAVIDVRNASAHSSACAKNPLPELSDLCYVNYTSGSSGGPKGVAIQHDGLANLVTWYESTYRVAPGDHMTQLARPSFDAYALEVWPCLASGATLHLGDATLNGSPIALQKWLADHRITICFLPTPLAEELLELSWPAGTTLRALLTGGDRLHRHPQGNLPFHLYNNYGPTEVTVVGTWCEVEPELASGDAAPPIGRPLPHMWAHILDAERQPVPQGEAGELYIGGVGVARGYLGRPDLTADQFFDDPSQPGERMYRTGDLVRERPDGQMDFLGRADEQIALHGFRIEPGEVEAALRRHPGVRDAVVVLADGGASPELVGYVVSDGSGEAADLEDVADFVTQSLPHYMVPATLRSIEMLPLTPRGKVDRRELERRQASPAPSGIGTRTEQEADAPRTTTEKLLARLWSEVLGVDTVRRQDSFFDLGGDSLLATRLARKAAGHGLHLGAADVFDHEQLHELARSLE
ncbi:non-ribosomal peptide synthetase [Streptomyces gilvosporeus]|nr:non-ribosomal peptide synthetase [Streptomyces gilvosporeus]